MWNENYDGSNLLYLIPTPIGNMEDITLRSINILKKVDIVFSEDTRVTKQLLDYLGLEKKLICLQDHNEDTVKYKVLEYLKNGLNVGLVTDRGTPIISDPGYKTVKFISNEGYGVVGLPGANAFVPALIMSGIAPQPFLFYGFLDSKENKKREELLKLKKYEFTIIFYEAPHRIKNTMQLILEIFGDREVSLSREISKKYESVYRGNITNLLDTLDGIKGEFVVVVSGACNNEKQFNDNDLINSVNNYISKGYSSKDSIKMTSMEYDINKNYIYQIYHRKDL